MQSALEAAARLVTPDGLLVLEHARRDDAPERTGSITKLRDIRSGDSALTVYRTAPGDPAGPDSAMNA
jgi:16S rRNA G966 N2-methylase RsmD